MVREFSRFIYLFGMSLRDQSLFPDLLYPDGTKKKGSRCIKFRLDQTKKSKFCICFLNHDAPFVALFSIHYILQPRLDDSGILAPSAL